MYQQLLKKPGHQNVLPNLKKIELELLNQYEFGGPTLADVILYNYKIYSENKVPKNKISQVYIFWRKNVADHNLTNWTRNFFWCNPNNFET